MNGNPAGNTAEVVFEQRDECLRIIYPDRFDVSEHIKIENAIEAFLKVSSREVILDFSHVRSIYSPGLGLMIRLQKKAADYGQKIVIENVSRSVFDLMTSLHLDKIFLIRQ